MDITTDTTTYCESPDNDTSTNEVDTTNSKSVRKEYRSKDGFVDEETNYAEFIMTNLKGEEILIKGIIIEIDSNVLYIRLKDTSTILCIGENNLPSIINEYIRDHQG